jgi:hypothetical protein
MNHQTSKISINSIWMKISLWVFKIWEFESGIGVLKRRGPLNSTGAGLLNHQTSKISINSIWMKISLWVFKIWWFEGGSGVFKWMESLNSTGAGLLNHQTSKISINSIWIKILGGCLEFDGLKVELGVLSEGDPLIPPGRGCWITKHLKLV